MGYPMTYQRVISRNGLADGDYGTLPTRWAGPLSGGPTTYRDDPEWQRTFEMWAAERKQLAGRIQSIAGDLRRLEGDALDEQAITVYIVNKTGVDMDTVALVLRAFMEW
jgi:hypothetical protein